MTELGKATGPQKKPRRGGSARAEKLHAEAREEGQEVLGDEDEALDGDQLVVRGDDIVRMRMMWSSTLQRMSEELQRMMAVLEVLPSGEHVRKPDLLPQQQMRETEQELTRLRVFLEQTGDMVL